MPHVLIHVENYLQKTCFLKYVSQTTFSYFVSYSNYNQSVTSVVINLKTLGSFFMLLILAECIILHHFHKFTWSYPFCLFDLMQLFILSKELFFFFFLNVTQRLSTFFLGNTKCQMKYIIKAHGRNIALPGEW